MISKLAKNNKSLFLILLCFLFSTCMHAPAITKPLEKESVFNQNSKRVWNESLPILVKSGGIIKNMNEDIGLIICELLLSPSQLAEVVLEGGGGGVGRQGKCIMNILIKEIEEEKTKVFLNTKFIVEAYSTFGGKLGEAFLSSNGKIEEDFFEKLSLALGEKKYDWLTEDEDTKEPSSPAEEKPSPAKDQKQKPQNDNEQAGEY